MRDANAAAAAPTAVEGGAHHLDVDRRELHRRLLWLAAFRIAAVTVLVGTTGFITLQGKGALGSQQVVALSALAVATNLLQIGVVVLLRWNRFLRSLALVQIAGDVAFAWALVYLTGGTDSIFTFLFLLAVVNGGILLSRHGAWFAAILSFGAYAALLLLLELGWIGPAFGRAMTNLGWVEIYQRLFTHGAAFGLTAVVASYSALQVERAGVRAEVAEDSLLKLGALHDAIVRSISSGIVATDPNDRITFVNRAGEEILGTSHHALRGRALDEIFPVLRPALGPEARGGQRLETTWRRPDGSERILGFHLNPLLDGEGGRLGTAAVFQDLTAYRELEERAARSERLATVGELSAGLAHELRNPLASISGSIEMLASNPANSEEDRQLLDIVLREADRLNDLVTEFLGFARPAPPQRQLVSLPALLGEVARMFAADPGHGSVRLQTELAPADAFLDPAQIRQVIWNLLRNAAQASEEGGTIRLRCGPGEEGMAFVSVEDEGAGIDPAVLPRIFDPFFTTKAEGTGLGLATVHRIVDAHGGTIRVQSVPGQGTIFHLSLPVSKQEEA